MPRNYRIPDEDIFIVDHNSDKKISRRNRDRAARRYKHHRIDAGTYRCDAKGCDLNRKRNPVWAGTTLPLQVDHRFGNNRDHGFENLRLICPNCHSQQPTAGGKNRGRRVMHESGGHSWHSPYPDHKEDRHIVTRTAQIKLQTTPIQIERGTKRKKISNRAT